MNRCRDGSIGSEFVGIYSGIYSYTTCPLTIIIPMPIREVNFSVREHPIMSSCVAGFVFIVDSRFATY